MIAPIVDWFDYAQITLEDAEDAPRPALPCVVESHRRRLRTRGLLDSGSDRSMLTPELARRLGVMPRRADTEIKVFGRVIPAGRVQVGIEFPVRRGSTRIAPVEFVVPVPAVEVPFMILGRNPLFEYFEVRFQDWRARYGLIGRDRAPVRTEPILPPARGQWLPVQASKRHRGRPRGLA